MNNHWKYLRFVVLAVSMASMSSCNDDNDDVPQVETPLTIKIVANEDFGKILVDQKNQSIYFFAKDVKDAGSNCSGGCATNWPAVTGEVSDLDLDASLSAADFGTVTLSDGQKQLTFKGWPLYYFAPGGTLEAAGKVTGDGGGNGTFFVAKPDYTVMLAQQAVVAGESPVMYLVDYRGVTLYTLSIDNENLSNCDGSCPTSWPALAATDGMMLPSALSKNDFAKAGTQLTFKGSPLYFFKNDENTRGNVKGQGAAGGKFAVAVPEGLANQPSKTIKLVEHEAFGKILVNQENQSIYFFAKDVINAGGNCNGGCLNSWKAATGDLADLGIGFGLSADDFGTVTLPNDDKQITYKGWPLYYFVQNGVQEAPGEVGGDNKATNSFFVGRPDYTVMVGRQTIDGDDSWYLVDDRGVTLYIDTNDTADQADCNSEGCLANWPLMLAPVQTVVPSALLAENFGTFSRGDLGQQLTFFTAQLYYFKNDLNIRGNVNGHGLADKFESARFQF